MRFDKLDLNLLVVLDALLTEVSIKKAAEKIFLSPSATSNALARLRDYFEDPLLTPIGKSMALTSKAIALKKPVHEVLLNIQTITTTTASFDPLTCDRRITIEAFDVTMHVFLHDVVRHCAQAAPLIRFNLRPMTPNFQANLDKGTTDLLVVPKAFTVTGHTAEHLYDDDWSCITWTGNDLPGTLSLEDYLALGHAAIHWEDERFHSHEETVLLQLGHVRRTEITVPGFLLLAPFLIGTRRVATLPTLLAHQLAIRYPVRVLPCPVPMPHTPLQLQWRKHHENDPAICWIREVMHQIAEKIAR